MSTLLDCASRCVSVAPVNIVGSPGGGGAAGPNTVTAATTTDQTGILIGNGANVSSVANPLPIANGGTGVATQADALTALLGGAGVPLSVANGGTGLTAAPTAAATPVTSSPGDPAGTTSATPVMMGIAISITPATSGRLLLLISGTASNAGGGAAAVTAIGLYSGTGAAVGNGVALPGTAVQVGKTKNILTGSAGGKIGFAISQIISGLTVATPYWFDLALTSDGANSAKVYDLDIAAIEL
jgi:hypothetical protein